jgi:hypothetical protein
VLTSRTDYRTSRILARGWLFLLNFRKYYHKCCGRCNRDSEQQWSSEFGKLHHGCCSIDNQGCHCWSNNNDRRLECHHRCCWGRRRQRILDRRGCSSLYEYLFHFRHCCGLCGHRSRRSRKRICGGRNQHLYHGPSRSQCGDRCRRRQWILLRGSRRIILALHQCNGQFSNRSIYYRRRRQSSHRRRRRSRWNRHDGWNASSSRRRRMRMPLSLPGRELPSNGTSSTTVSIAASAGWKHECAADNNADAGFCSWVGGYGHCEWKCVGYGGRCGVGCNDFVQCCSSCE